jgi:hypothetical protein
VLLALTGLTLVSSPDAHAAVQHHVELSIGTSATTVNEGQPVTVRGKARHGVAKTRVQLQHRSSGMWEAVATQRVSDTLHYSFLVTPARGHQRYRTVTLARRHQPWAHSVAVSVAVRWQPTISVTAAPVTVDDGSQWVDITGQVHDGPTPATVEIEYADAGLTTAGDPLVWHTLEVVHPDGDAPFTIRESRDNGYEYRLVLDETDVTDGATSSTVTHRDPAFVLPMNGGLLLHNLPAADSDTVAIDVDLQAGQNVTLAWLAGGGNWWHGVLKDPSGTVVGQFTDTCSCNYNTLQLTAAQTGTYRIDADIDAQQGDLSIWASVPKVVKTTLDAVLPVDGDVPGQTVDLTFPAAVGDAFTVADATDNWTHRDVRTPGGSAMSNWLSHTIVSADIYRAEDAGTYTVRYTADGAVHAGTVRLLEARQETAVVDGDPVTVDIDDPARIGLVWGDLDGGDVMSVVTDLDHTELKDTEYGLSPTLPGVPGKHLVIVSTPFVNVTGSATVRAGSPLELTADVDGEPASYDLSGWMPRGVDLSFTGTAGEAVEPASSTDLYLDRPTLYDGQGEVVTGVGVSAWVLPADGTYVMRTYLHTNGPGTMGIRSVPIVDVATDGSDATLTLTHGDGSALGRLVAPAGTPISATLSSVDDSLNTHWVVAISDSQGRGIDFWTETLLSGNHPPDTRPTFTVPSDGVVYFRLYSTNDDTGAVRLSTVVDQG